MAPRRGKKAAVDPVSNPGAPRDPAGKEPVPAPRHDDTTRLERNEDPRHPLEEHIGFEFAPPPPPEFNYIEGLFAGNAAAEALHMDLSFQRKGPKQPLSSVDFLVNIKSLFDEYLEYRPLEDRDTITDILSVIEDMFFDLTPNITRDYYYTVRNTDLIADIKTILTARQHENRLLAEKHNVSTDEVQAAIERLEFDTIAKSAPPAEDVTRAAAEVTASAIALTLPKVAPEFYADRLDKTESAPDFFTRVWGKWVDIIYQDDLGVRDRKLVRALRNYAYHHGISLSSILPPPKRVRTEKLAAEAREGSAEAAIARARLLGRGRAARFRQRKSQHS